MIVPHNSEFILFLYAIEIGWGNLALTWAMRCNDDTGALVYFPLLCRFKNILPFQRRAFQWIASCDCTNQVLYIFVFMLLCQMELLNTEY